MADGPVPVKMKGSDFKNFNAYEVDGTLYTAPVVLTKGGKWKLSWEKDKLYVELTPAAMKKKKRWKFPIRNWRETGMWIFLLQQGSRPFLYL